MHLSADGSLHILVVWIDMLEADSAEAAQRAAARFGAQSGIEHFHDPERKAGSAVAQGLGAPGKIAWDFYLLYPKRLKWQKTAPSPAGWFHQLQEEPWAGQDHLRWGKALRPAIDHALPELLGLRAA
jgi:hypothetical protein